MVPMRGVLKPGHETFRLSNITNARALSDPAPLSVRHVKFKTDYRNPIEIPHNVVGPKGGSRGCLDVGQIPED